MAEILNFANVELYYDRVYALKNVSLTVNQGETVALIGANGAGKSSILRAITGLRKIKSGEIHYEGRRIDGTNPALLVPPTSTTDLRAELRRLWLGRSLEASLSPSPAINGVVARARTIQDWVRNDLHINNRRS